MTETFAEEMNELARMEYKERQERRRIRGMKRWKNGTEDRLRKKIIRVAEKAALRCQLEFSFVWRVPSDAYTWDQIRDLAKSLGYGVSFTGPFFIDLILFRQRLEFYPQDK